MYPLNMVIFNGYVKLLEVTKSAFSGAEKSWSFFSIRTSIILFPTISTKADQDPESPSLSWGIKYRCLGRLSNMANVAMEDPPFLIIDRFSQWNLHDHRVSPCISHLFAPFFPMMSYFSHQFSPWFPVVSIGSSAGFPGFSMPFLSQQWFHQLRSPLRGAPKRATSEPVKTRLQSLKKV